MSTTQTKPKQAAATAKGGLEGIVAGRSALCRSTGSTGRLLYAGYDIVDLGARSRASRRRAGCCGTVSCPPRRSCAACAKTWARPRPARGRVGRSRRCGRQRGPHGPAAHPGVAAGDVRRRRRQQLQRARPAKATRLVAQTPALDRHQRTDHRGLGTGRRRARSRASPGTSCTCSRARSPTRRMHAFDVCLILHAEHGMNTSTFAARVTAATLSDMHSAVVSAIGTLKGPLHGGANERVMERCATCRTSRARARTSKRCSPPSSEYGFGPG